MQLSYSHHQKHHKKTINCWINEMTLDWITVRVPDQEKPRWLYRDRRERLCQSKTKHIQLSFKLQPPGLFLVLFLRAFSSNCKPYRAILSYRRLSIAQSIVLAPTVEGSLLQRFFFIKERLEWVSGHRASGLFLIFELLFQISAAIFLCVNLSIVKRYIGFCWDCWFHCWNMRSLVVVF